MTCQFLNASLGDVVLIETGGGAHRCRQPVFELRVTVEMYSDGDGQAEEQMCCLGDRVNRNDDSSNKGSSSPNGVDSGRICPTP